jgi:hypothetical protein
MAEFDPNTAMIAIGLALWTATGTVISSAKIINERRDIVISGYDGSRKLDKPHRKLIMRNDWAPMAFVMGYLSLCVAIFLLAIPDIIPTAPRYVVWSSWAVAFAFFISTLSWLVGGIAEYRVMQRAIDNTKDDDKSG